MRRNITRRDFLEATVLAVPASAALSTARASSGRALPFKLGVITDEISEDLDQALDFLAAYSLTHCELREISKKNIMNLSQEELTRARDLIRKRGFRVSDIASPLFKYNLPEMPARENEKRDTFSATFTDQDTDDLLRRAFEIARLFDTNKIRIFSYWRVDEPEKAYPHVRDRLAKAAAMAGKEKMLLVLENEPACNVGSGKELGRLLREVNSPHLRGVWDPGNVTMLGEIPYPDGYREVRGLFAHMHVKDAKRNPQTGKLDWVPVGDGMVDFHGQFKALREDKYEGTMSLETHYRRPDGNRMESTRESLKGLLKVLGEIG